MKFEDIDLLKRILKAAPRHPKIIEDLYAEYKYFGDTTKNLWCKGDDVEKRQRGQ